MSEKEQTQKSIKDGKKQKTLHVPIEWEKMIKKHYFGTLSSFMLTAIQEKIERDLVPKEEEENLTDRLLQEYSKLSMIINDICVEKEDDLEKGVKPKSDFLSPSNIRKMLDGSTDNVKDAIIKRELNKDDE